MTDFDAKYRDYFEKAKAVCTMILDAQEDLKQLKLDAKEELVAGENLTGEDAKRVRAELTEVFALAMMEAKGEQETKKQAEKIERRQKVAEIVGVQLGLFSAPEPARQPPLSESVRKLGRSSAVNKLRESIASGEMSIEAGGQRIEADGKGGVRSVDTSTDALLAESIDGMKALRGERVPA